MNRSTEHPVLLFSYGTLQDKSVQLANFGRELTGQQGVIIPACNVRHLSLNQAVVSAVEQGRFHIWAIERADEALPLLTGKVWDTEDGEGDSLLRTIQERISQLNQSDVPHRPWGLRWLNWFNHR